MGPAAPARHLRAAAGNPHLLQIPRCRHRSLSARRRRSTGDALRACDGADGVPIGGIARRALFAWYFADPNILLSQYITAESRIVFRRNIQERVRAIAPFLRLDMDPYIVISGGRLYWIQDAYAVS